MMWEPAGVDAEHRARLPLECLAGHETGAGVVLRLDDDRRALCQHFGHSCLLQIEILRARRVEEREDAHDAA